MNNKLFETYIRLLRSTKYKTHRYLYNSFNINSRITGLVGPRGTGKTTLLLQFIKNNFPDKNECIYVSLDNIYFSHTKLVDFVEELYAVNGVKYYFLDEIHKYKNWNQEIKNLYDSYPDIKIIFSGSSSLDLIKGTYDLSRRGVLFRLDGLSFREYLNFKNINNINPVSFDEIIKNRKEIEYQTASVERIRGHFLDYLENGYYPFFFEDKVNYHHKVMNIIKKSVYEDISNFYNLKTENLGNFFKILSYLATIPPGVLNRNNISKTIGIDNKTVQNYLNILDETGLIHLIKENKSGSNLLKNSEKIYLDNSNLYKTISDELGFTYNKGTVREIFFIKMLENAGHKVFFSKVGDFEVKGNFFEIGGRNKNRKQIKNNLENSFTVKDNISISNKNEIPLFLFGFMY